VEKLTDAALTGAQDGVQQAKDAASAAVAQQVAAGTIPAAAQAQVTAAAEQQAIQQAATAIQEKLLVAKIAADGTVTLDFSDATARRAFVDQAVP
ncbi:hypothetical protein AB0127_27230, partial [Klebsiella pneumoniae]